jgi:hypothetical protein
MKIKGDRRKRLIADLADHAQGMITPNPRFQIDIAEKLTRPIVCPAHSTVPADTQTESQTTPERKEYFSSLLEMG